MENKCLCCIDNPHICVLIMVQQIKDFVNPSDIIKLELLCDRLTGLTEAESLLYCHVFTKWSMCCLWVFLKTVRVNFLYAVVYAALSMILRLISCHILLFCNKC